MTQENLHMSLTLSPCCNRTALGLITYTLCRYTSLEFVFFRLSQRSKVSFSLRFCTLLMTCVRSQTFSRSPLYIIELFPLSVVQGYHTNLKFLMSAVLLVLLKSCSQPCFPLIPVYHGINFFSLIRIHLCISRYQTFFRLINLCTS